MESFQDGSQERLDLQEILNPRPKISSWVTFAHLLWLKRWIILAAWMVVGIPLALFLAVYDIPRTYSATSRLRFPNVVGAEGTMVRDMALVQSGSILSLFDSYNVLSRTIRSQKLQFRVWSQEIFRRNVFEEIQYEDNAPTGDYTFVFLPSRSVEVIFYSPVTDSRSVLYRDTLPEDGVLSLPSISLRVNRKMLALKSSVKIQAEFLSLPRAIQNLKKYLDVSVLDQNDGSARVNYAVTLEGHDPYLIAEVVNDLVNNFIAVYSGTTEGQDESVLGQMTRDLEAARQREEGAREALARFYATHPVLLETPQAQGFDLVGAQAEKKQLEERLDNLQLLRNRMPPPEASNPVKTDWISDAVFVLSSYGVLHVNSIQTRLREAEAKRAELLAVLPPTHPRLAALDSGIAALLPEAEHQVAATYKTWFQKLQKVKSEVEARLPRNIPIAADLEAKRLTTEKEAASRAVEELQSAYNRARFSMRDIFKVTVVDAARPPLYQPPSLERRLLFSSAAFLLSFFPSLFWFLFRQAAFSRIYTRDDAERKLKARVLGEVFQQKSLQTSAWKDIPEFSMLPQLENFRLLRSEIENFFSREDLAFLVTSTRPGEGKSTFSANVAASFARYGLRTLLVDADLRRGSLTRMFGVQEEVGLIDLLREPAGPDREGWKNLLFAAILPSKEKNLFFLSRGGRGAQTGDPIGLGRMEEFIPLFRGEFDVLIVDSSPVLPVSDALNLMKAIPNVAFVIQSGEIPSSLAKEVLDRIRARGGKVGCVLNALRETPFIRNPFSQYRSYYSGPETGSTLPVVVGKKRSRVYPSAPEIEKLPR